MKIIQLLQRPQLRGAELFASQLSRELQRLGHDVVLVFLFRGSDSFPYSGRMVHLNFSESNKFFAVHEWQQLASLIKAENPDIVQANASDTLKYAVMSRCIFRWDAQLVYRNANLISYFTKGLARRLYNRFLLHRADHVISVSSRCAEDVINRFHVPKKLVTTICIGVDSANDTTFPDDLFNLLKNRPFLLHVGGFVPEKNHEGLLRIFSRVMQQFPELQLVLVGMGPGLPKIKSLIQEMGLASRVHMLGARPDVRAIMPYSAAFVLPSLIEGLPGVILEAMYARCPVIAYDCGGIPDVVHDGETGWMVKTNDESSMVESIISVVGGPSEKKDRVIKRALEMVQRSYMNEHVALSFQSVYLNLLNERMHSV